MGTAIFAIGGRPGPYRRWAFQCGKCLVHRRLLSSRTQAARDSKRLHLVRVPLGGRQPQNPIASCACQPNFRWPRVRAAMWVAGLHRKFGRNRRLVPVHNLAHTTAP
eukprot:646253-Pleurochrysis_carterae.AAC.1